MTFNSLLFVVCVFLTSGEIWLSIRRQRFWSPQIRDEEIKVFSFETPALFALVFLAPMAWVLEISFVALAQFATPHLQWALIVIFFFSLVGVGISFYFGHKYLESATIPEKWPD
jgi:hypothetical protein